MLSISASSPCTVVPGLAATPFNNSSKHLRGRGASKLSLSSMLVVILVPCQVKILSSNTVPNSSCFCEGCWMRARLPTHSSVQNLFNRKEQRQTKAQSGDQGCSIHSLPEFQKCWLQRHCDPPHCWKQRHGAHLACPGKFLVFCL